MLHKAFIGLGSNMGDKITHCRNGIAKIARIQQTEIARESCFYQTEPLDYLPQDWFINAAILINTDLDPFSLLKALRQIEAEAGKRLSEIRFGPRPLDLDIIFYDNLIISTPDLIIPHPRMHKRGFVLMPVCDIDPYFKHPVLNREIQDILHDPDVKSQQVRVIT